MQSGVYFILVDKAGYLLLIPIIIEQRVKSLHASKCNIICYTTPILK